MKQKVYILAFLTIELLIIVGCTKDAGDEGDNGGGGSGATTGQAIFWIQSDFGCGNITVTCGGLNRQITGYYSSGTPDCAGSWGAKFTLDPGTYNFSASCTGKTWSGTITITAGNCSVIQLTNNGGSTGGGASVAPVIFWVDSDFGCGPINVTMGGVTKQITAYQSTAPSCGAAGFATFDLGYVIAGYTASCTGKTWTGTVTTAPGTCTKIKLTNSGGGGGGTSSCNWNSAVNYVSVTKRTGTRCGDPQSVEIIAKNTSNQYLKIYICIQNANGTWDGAPDGTFTTGVPPNGTTVRYVCKGTGQYKIGAMLASNFNTYNCPYPSCN